MIFKPKDLDYCEQILEKEWSTIFEIYSNFKSYVKSMSILDNNYAMLYLMFMFMYIVLKMETFGFLLMKQTIYNIKMYSR